jgi:hypothetical protein
MARLTAVLLVLLGSACSRSSSTAPAGTPSGADAAGIAASTPAVGPTSSESSQPPQISPAVFSAPIAATRIGEMRMAAGLVAAEGVLRVIGWPVGQPPWFADPLRGVSWTPDAELRLEPAGDGVALLWRGSVNGKARGVVVLLGPRGESRGEPVAVGASFCTTTEGIAWIDPHAAGPVHVRARAWADVSPHEVTALSSDRAPSLVCGDHVAFVLGDGDDDLTSTAFSPADAAASPPVVVEHGTELGDDEEREHEAFTSGDVLGFVRVGGSGVVAMREVTRERSGPWRRLKHRLSEDDDVVAVDGDPTASFIVYTRDASDGCRSAAGTAESVHALRVDRATGLESLVDLAVADCDTSRGPFWIGASSGGPLAAWVERGANKAGAAPIVALASGSLREEEPPPTRRRAVTADALVQGGCGASCFAAALVRAPDGDGSQPASIEVLQYP